MTRSKKSRGTRVPPKDGGLTRIATGEYLVYPDPEGNRAERRKHAKGKGQLGKRDRGASDV